METKIPRGKVIRVPADIKLKGSQSQYMPHIIADADKIKSVIEDLSKIFCLTGLPFNALEWIAPETFPQYESLTSASNIPELLEGDQEMLQEAFGKAKFIIRLKIDSKKFNYYYTDENLPQEFSLLDVIACLGNASRIQERCNHISSSLDFGDSRKPLVFEFNNYSLPIVKISLSDAKYTAKVHDAIYCSARSSHVVAGLNHVLAKLMVAEVNYTEDQVVKLVQPVQNIKNLFVFYEEMPELEEKLYMARMIKSLGVEDGYEYFYLVESDSRLGVVDIMERQKDIAAISIQTSGLEACNWVNCPFTANDINQLGPTHTNNFLNKLQSIDEKYDILSRLEGLSSDSDNGEILKVLRVLKGSNVADFCQELLTDATNAEAVKTGIINSLKRKKSLKIDIDIQSSGQMAVTFNETALEYPRHESGEKKGKKINSKMNHAPYVLLVMLLYKLYKRKKEEGKGGTIFQFSNSGNISGKYDEQVVYPSSKEPNKRIRKDIFYNKGLAVLYGFVYNIFNVNDFQRQTDEYDKWVDYMAKYLGTERVTCGKYGNKLGPSDLRKHTVENLLKNIHKIVDFEKRKGGNDILDEDKEMSWELCKDFIYLVSNIDGNGFESASYAALEWNLKRLELNNFAMLIGAAVMPDFTWDDTGNSECFEKIKEAFFELFAYLEGAPSENHSNKIN